MVTQVTDFVLKPQYGFWIVVISKLLCLLIIRHKKKIMQEDPQIHRFYLFNFLFVFVFEISVVKFFYSFAAFARKIC